MRLALMALVALLVTPVGAAERSIELPPDLARVLTDYEKAWRAHDAHALAALFTEDGFVLPGDGVPVRGRSAIEAHYAEAGGPLVLRAFDCGADGSVGFIIGGFAKEAGLPDAGKFTLTLRKDGKGRWLIASDMDSPNAPRP